MERLLMDHIQSILAAYPIQAVSIEKVTDHVSKIFDGQRTYALKKSRLTEATVLEWEEVYHEAAQYQLHELLPIYMTIDGTLTVPYDRLYYYLTPWISTDNTDKKQQMERLYDMLGSIHAKTKQTINIDAEKIGKQFKGYQEQIKDHRSFLTECITVFEQSRFMAPAELFFCTHYRDIDLLLQTLDDQVVRFIDAINEEPKWSYSLCHGRIDFSHCLVGSHTYIINWEDACHDNPVRDLSTLFRTVIIDYDDPVEDFLRDFSIYTERNPLTEAEIYLLSIYLLDPTTYIDLVMQYRNNPDEHGQVDMIQQLQQAYRTLSFAMKWVHFTGNEEMDSSEI